MSKKKTQKVLIPKGTIDPNEDTLIEIPVTLKDQPVVVAKRTDITRSIRTPAALQEDRSTLSTSLNQSKLRHQQRNNDSFTPSFNSTFADSSDLYQMPPSVSNLDETEITERDAIQKKLEDFQLARRELLLGTSSIATKSSQLNPPVNYENDLPPSLHSSRVKSNIRQSATYDPDYSLNPTFIHPIHSSVPAYDDAFRPAPTRTSTKPTRSSGLSSHDDMASAVQSLYVRPTSSYGKSHRSDNLISPQDSYILAKKHNVNASHRKYEKYKSKQCKQVQTEANIEDDEEEEDSCLCLSKSINSFSKSASGCLRKR